MLSSSERPDGFVQVSESPLAYVWEDFASRAECDALVARGEAARAFTLAEQATITYGVEGFRRCICMNGKIYAEIAAAEEEEYADLDDVTRTLVERFTARAVEFLGHGAHVAHEAQWCGCLTKRLVSTAC